MLFEKYRQGRREARQSMTLARQVVFDPELQSARSELLMLLRPDTVPVMEAEVYEGRGHGFSESVRRSIDTPRFIGHLSAAYVNPTRFDGNRYGDSLPTQESLTIAGTVGDMAVNYDDELPVPPHGMSVHVYMGLVTAALTASVELLRSEEAQATKEGEL